MVMALRIFLVVGLIAGLMSAVRADVQESIMGKNIAFSIDDRDFSYLAVTHLIGESKKHNPSLQPKKLVRGLIENHLLTESLAREDSHPEPGNEILHASNEKHPDTDEDKGGNNP